MNDIHDLELVLGSHIPIVVVESQEERRVMDMLSRLRLTLGRQLYRWTVTDGLLPVFHVDMAPPIPDPEGKAARFTEPARATDALAQIKSATRGGIYLLLDFHPYLDDPVTIRLLKEIAYASESTDTTVVLLSHELRIPIELDHLTVSFRLSLPSRERLIEMIREEAKRWSRAQHGRRVKTDNVSLDMMVRYLSGLTLADARRLVRKAIQHDGAITQDDLPAVAQAKYDLLNKEGVLSFEQETAEFSDVGGLESLKRWLHQRRATFVGETETPGVDPPKGIMLLGVQGGGKSLAAKAVAGTWCLPLLRLDFGTLYNKYFGETERNLRRSLQIAEAMSPCVLWIDELEKGISPADHDGGTSRRVLGTLLTWMAERRKPVFIVATANEIQDLPPELVRKGRLDEIFFVDLPDEDTRAQIFAIHLRKRGQEGGEVDLARLADATEGFTGAEIEQVVIGALFTAQAEGRHLDTELLLAEVTRTRPLSVVMAERIGQLRAWAAHRTVPAN